MGFSSFCRAVLIIILCSSPPFLNFGRILLILLVLRFEQIALNKLMNAIADLISWRPNMQASLHTSHLHLNLNLSPKCTYSP